MHQPVQWGIGPGQLSAQAIEDGAGQQPHMRARSTALSVACILLLVLSSASAQPAPNATTAPTDAAAVAKLLQGLAPQTGSILATWRTNTDPCSSWQGVICRCEDLPIRSLATACASSTFNSSAVELRVLGLDLGPMANAGGQKLEGELDPMIGDLQELLYLDLSNNEFRGVVPTTLSSLSKLQWLLLDNNLFQGPLPQYLGDFPNMKQAQLQHNNFSGPVPAQWCSSNATYHVAHNPILCGAVPSCFQETPRINDLEGTYLSVGAASEAVCDITPPDCDLNAGCVIWTPEFWTSRSTVIFNFTGFLDYDSGIPRYEWGLGSQQGRVDVVPWMEMTANRVLKDVRYNGGTQKMMVTYVVHNLATISLLEGHKYHVTVKAWNGAGPPLYITSSSAAVIIDSTPPVPGEVFNTYTFEEAETTFVTQTLSASWESFVDPESPIKAYEVVILEELTAKNGSTVYKALYGPVLYENTTTRLSVPTAPLPLGTRYLVQVTARNKAELETTVRTIPIVVSKPGPSIVTAANAALIGAMCGVFCLIVGAVLAVIWGRHRMRHLKAKEKRRAEDAKQLKALMYALSSQGDLPAGRSSSISAPHSREKGGKEKSDNEVAFVFTDIESSTELSQQDPNAFKQVQEIHDQLMREGIAKHGGYEITTEGDSFQVAFTTCHAAMAFCLDIQYRLLEQPWPKQVLALNACKMIRDPETGQPLFAGPRVRMGLHWGRDGTVVMRQHSITRHKVYAGPAVHITMDVSEAANGGQVLLTDEAVLKLSEDMSLANFPVIKLLGMFQLPSLVSPVNLFGCTEVVGKPLKRQFAGLRKISQVWPLPGEQLPPTLEYNISPGPLPNDNGSLVFVVLRLTTYPRNKPCDLPRSVAEKFSDVFSSSAQQFKGYIFETKESTFMQGVWTVAFQDSMDALRFTHAAQMLLMYVPWTGVSRDYCGTALPSPDGRWLYIGPRVCMAIHESADYFVCEDRSTTAARKPMRFVGPAVTLPLVLTCGGKGGQIILSETAWDSVKETVTQHPGAVSIISLGKHEVSDVFPHPMLLMEVMPTLLSRRTFRHLDTRKQVEPGFRDAPNPNEPMAIVFAKVAKPDTVVEAEKGASGTEDENCAIIQAYQLSVIKYTTVARRLLHKYGGYECKEPEPGKFTLAFKELNNAVRWAAHLQEEILYLDWPEKLLQMKGCQAESVNGHLVWRGLRLRIGMAYGMVTNQKPLNTGRADYFGMLPNGAARVMALACPGQVLIEASNPDGKGPPLLQTGSPTALQLLYPPGTHSPCKHLQSAAADADVVAGMEEPVSDFRAVHVHAVGYYLLRGLDNARLLFSAETTRLKDRPLEITGVLWMPAAGVFGGSGHPNLNASFGSESGIFRQLASFGGRTLGLGRGSNRGHSTSPTSVDSIMANRKHVRSKSPSAAFSGGSAAFSHAAAGVAHTEGPTRSKSTLSGVVGRAHHSEAGRASFGAQAAAVRSGVPTGAHGPASPQHPRGTRTQSESAVGRPMPHAAHLAELQRIADSTAGRIVVDASGQSEDESGGTPAAASATYRSAHTAAGRDVRNAAWLVDSSSVGQCPDAAGAVSWVADSNGRGHALISQTVPATRTFSGTDVAAAVAALTGVTQQDLQGSASRRIGPAPAPAPLPGECKDPLIGAVHVPPIHTTVAPEHVWSEASGQTSAASSSVCRSDSGSPFSILQPGSASSSQALVARSSGGVPKPPQQQPHQQLQLQQQQRLRSAQQIGHSSGGSARPPAVDPAAEYECLQPWQQQGEAWHERQHEQLQLQSGDQALGTGGSTNGGLFQHDSTTPYSLSTTMTSYVDPDEAMLQAEQDRAVANMKRMVSERADSEASFSYSGAAGMGNVFARMRRSRQSGSTGGALMAKGVKALFAKVVRRRSTSAGMPGSPEHASAGGRRNTAAGYMSDESTDEEVEAVQQQHGMIRHDSNPSSLSLTPNSSAPGSMGGADGTAGQLMSPNTFAHDVAYAYACQRRSNSSISAGYGSQGGLEASFRSGQAGSAFTGAAAGSNGEGSFGGASLAKSSFSRGGSYTYADSSYSPTHCRPSINAVAVWQGYGHQQELQPESRSGPLPQQQHQMLPSKLSGPQLTAELSLRASQGSFSTAAAAAVRAVDAAMQSVRHADVVPQLQAGREGLQPQSSDFSLPILRPQQQQQQPPQQQQQQQQQWAEGVGPELGTGQSPEELSKLAQQDAVAQRLSQSMWASEDGRRRILEQQQPLDSQQQQFMQQQQLYAQQQECMVYQPCEGVSQGLAQELYISNGESHADCVSYIPGAPQQAVGLAAAGGAQFCDSTAAAAASGLLPADSGTLEDEVPARRNSSRAKAAETLQKDWKAALALGHTVINREEYRARMVKERESRNTPAHKLPVYVPPPDPIEASWQAASEQPSQEFEQQPVPMVPPSPRRQIPAQQQQVQQMQQFLRLSPLGKAAAQGAQQGAAATPGSGGLYGATAAAAEPLLLSAGGSPARQASLGTGAQHLMPYSLQCQQEAAAAGAVPVLPNLASSAKRAIAGLNPEEAGRNYSPRAGSPSAAMQYSAAVQGGSVKRAATLLHAGGLQTATPADLLPSSRDSSGPNSPRFASASSSLQRVPSNAMSLQSHSPRASLPNTPRSAQRASLAAASLAAASFASSTYAGAAPGSPVAAAAGMGNLLARAGSSSSMGSAGLSPRYGMSGAQAWAGVGRAGDELDSDELDEQGFGVYSASPGVRARTPSLSIGVLNQIPELPAAFESRTSDPSTDNA